MNVPFDLFYSSLTKKKVYFFSSSSTIGIGNHRHVCVTKTDNDTFFVCTTSQEKTMNRLIEIQGLPSSTIVHVPKSESYLTQDTFINCNEVFVVSKAELKREYECGNINLKGEMKDVYYSQILNGVHESILVDEEIKDIVPKEL